MDEDVAAKEEEIKRLQAKLTEASVALLHANEITMEKVDEAREEERTRVEQLELRVTKKDKTIQVCKPTHTHTLHYSRTLTPYAVPLQSHLNRYDDLMRQKEYLDRDLSELRQLMVEVEEQHGMTGMVCMCACVSCLWWWCHRLTWIACSCRHLPSRR